MTYIELVNNFWELDETWQFTCCETRLYFYLLKTANRLGWVDSWTRSDAKVSSDVGVSVNSMKTARNRLSQAGLAEFDPGGKGQRDKTRYRVCYQFRCQNLTPKQQPNHIPNLTPNPQPKVDPLLYNKTKNKTKTKNNTPPTPPRGDGDKESALNEREKALRALEEDLRKRERELALAQEPPGKPAKIPNPLNSGGRKIFEDHFRNIFSSEYYWTAKDAGSMSKLLQKLKYLREQKKMPVSDEDILGALKYLLSSIEEGWIFENFSVTNINSKFNEIVSQAQAKAKQNGQTTSNSGTIKPGQANRYTPGRTNAEDSRASLKHLGELADAILQCPTPKNGG